MIIFKQRGIRVAEIWFDAGLAPVSGVDVVNIRRSPYPVCGQHNYESHTLVSDLSMATDLLFNRIRKVNRHDVHRAEIKDKVSCKILTRPSADDYELFVDFYNIFASQKGLPSLPPLARTIAHSYLANGNLTFTCALRDGEPLVWHSYFVQGDRCRILYSASHFRGTDDTDFRNMVGRANRWLHWKDMMLFKEQGLCTYDWGGWAASKNPVLIKINQFKESFGGIPVKVYDARYGITLRGRLENTALQIVRYCKNLRYR